MAHREHHTTGCRSQVHRIDSFASPMPFQHINHPFGNRGLSLFGRSTNVMSHIHLGMASEGGLHRTSPGTWLPIEDINSDYSGYGKSVYTAARQDEMRAKMAAFIGAKLAGALNGLAYGRDLRDSAFVVACLKRALSHLHAAQEGLAEVQADKVKTLPSDTIDRVRKELFEIREGILSLMDEFRGRSMG